MDDLTDCLISWIKRKEIQISNGLRESRQAQVLHNARMLAIRLLTDNNAIG